MDSSVNHSEAAPPDYFLVAEVHIVVHILSTMSISYVVLTARVECECEQWNESGKSLCNAKQTQVRRWAMERRW
jgi:hypothetical protein